MKADLPKRRKVLKVKTARRAEEVAEKATEAPSAGKSRKEARKEQLSQRFAEKLQKLEVAAARIATLPADQPDRHAPKHTEGSFWKQRKEKKKRTVFLGSLPSSFDKRRIEELITQQVPEAVVEAVDLIGAQNAAQRRFAKAVAAYVCLGTLEQAWSVKEKLNGFAMPQHHTTLRCNFSNDKEERQKAIAKRG